MLTVYSTLPALTTATDTLGLQEATNGISDGTEPRKRKGSKKDQTAVEDDFNDPDLDTSTSPDTTKTPAKKRRKKGAASPDTRRTSSAGKIKKGKQPQSPAKARKGSLRETSPQPVPPVKDKCLRCK
jgi:hypothetical protein